MSFSSEQKNQIIEKTYKSACCRKALLMGVIFSKAHETEDDGTIEISIEKREYCTYVSKLIREFYGADAEILSAPSGGRRYLITFRSDSASEYIRSIDTKKELFIIRCPICQSAFLRGVFLASARASNPKSAYSIHFSLGVRSVIFADCLRELELFPLLSGSGDGMVAYFKDGASIENFYGITGMNRAMFELIDAKLEADIRRNVARVANCETNNIKKAVDAAGKQYDIILALSEANLLSSLPDDLAATARLRLEHKEMSLSQLAAISTPPISKPGLSHRLKKIMELGEKLLRNNRNL